MRATARLGALASGLAIGALSCARPMAPPGGERDVVAPRLVSTKPGPLEVVAAGSTPVIFRFDERVSERGFSEALVSVSPLDSTLRVDRSGAEVRVQIDGGWRPDRVYRVVLLPGTRDLFGNERREPVELVFST
ncbi:MAG: Ig-like domain-containing protein, partial [Longimicrobiales bacterium]